MLWLRGGSKNAINMQNDRTHHPRPQLSLEANHGEAPHAQDHWRVDLAEAWEVSFWSREFNCSESELRQAVKEVGNKAGAVRGYFACYKS